MVPLIILNALFATTYPLLQCALQYLNPLPIVAIRMALGSIILLGFHTLVLKRRLRVAQRDIGIIIAAGTCSMYLSFVSEAWALRTIPACRAALWYMFTPFITALIERFGEKRMLTTRQWLCIGAASIGGIGALLWEHGSTALGTLHFNTGDAAMFLAMISGALGWFGVKKLLSRGYRLSHINGLTMLVSTLLSVLTLLLIPSWSPSSEAIRHTFGWHAGGSIVALVLISNVAAYTLYGSLLQYYSITAIMLADFMSPLFAALYDGIAWGTRIPPSTLCSFICTSICVYIFTRNPIISSACTPASHSHEPQKT